MGSRALRCFIVVFVIFTVALSVSAQDSLNVSTMGQSFFWGPLWDMDVYQEHLYVCDYYAYLWIVDISNPESPQMMSPFKTPHHASDILIEGNTAFIADGLDGGLVILDLSEPASPETISGLNSIDGYSKNISKVDTLVFLQTNASISSSYDDSRIYIISISDIFNPIILDTIDFDSKIYEMEQAGDFLYLQAENSVMIMDISIPSNPVIANTIISNPNQIYALAVENNLLMVTDWDAVAVYDVANPYTPIYLSAIEGITFPYDILIDDNIAYILHGIIETFDMTNPEDPLQLDEFVFLQTAGYMEEFMLLGDFLYASTMEKGIIIVNAQDPENLSLTGKVDTEGNPYSILLDDDLVYMANRDLNTYYNSPFVVMDVQNPYSPEIAGKFEFEGNNYQQHVYVEGSKAYVLELQDVNIIDISNPDSMTLLGAYNTDWTGVSSTVRNDTVYLCCGASGLKILDASDPQNLTLIGEFDTPGSVRAIYLDGSLGYLTDGWEGFVILDLSNPTQPQEISRLDDYGYFEDFEYSEGIVYVVDIPFGFRIIDVRNTEDPVFISHCDIGESTFALDYQWNYLYVANEYYGLLIFDVSNPNDPVEVGLYHPTDYDYYNDRFDVCVQGEIAYYATPLCFYTLDISQAVGVADRPANSSPYTFTLHPNYPNPFNAQTVIPFTLDYSGRVKIDIFDITGRSVGVQNFEPLQAWYPAGGHEVVWNAEGMASGVYLVRLTVDGGQQSAEVRKTILLK